MFNTFEAVDALTFLGSGQRCPGLFFVVVGDRDGTGEHHRRGKYINNWKARTARKQGSSSSK